MLTAQLSFLKGTFNYGDVQIGCPNFQISESVLFWFKGVIHIHYYSFDSMDISNNFGQIGVKNGTGLIMANRDVAV